MPVRQLNQTARRIAFGVPTHDGGFFTPEFECTGPQEFMNRGAFYTNQT